MHGEDKSIRLNTTVDDDHDDGHDNGKEEENNEDGSVPLLNICLIHTLRRARVGFSKNLHTSFCCNNQPLEFKELKVQGGSGCKGVAIGQ